MGDERSRKPQLPLARAWCVVETILRVSSVVRASCQSAPYLVLAAECSPVCWLSVTTADAEVLQAWRLTMGSALPHR